MYSSLYDKVLTMYASVTPLGMRQFNSPYSVGSARIASIKPNSPIRSYESGLLSIDA
jgi:hypothetical protein